MSAAPIAIRPAPRTAVTPPADPAQIWTITASLSAARTESDGSILLAVCEPTGRPHRMILRMPHPDNGPADICLNLRAAVARRNFIRDIVNPPFEGFVLLYGTARITLTRSEHNPATPDVVDFAIEDVN